MGSPGANNNSALQRLLPWAIGIWLGLAILKFGNPTVLDHLVATPENPAEWIFAAWPMKFSFPLTILVIAASLPLIRKVQVPKAFVILPAAWLLWQFIAATQTISPALTQPTVVHFTITIAAFYVGLFALSRCERTHGLWTPLLVAFGYMLWVGFEQRHGGLEAMRRMIYEQPNWQDLPQDYLKKIASNRIFATMVYPNALAGIILLLLPILSWKLWAQTINWPRIPRAVLIGIFGYAALACFYWTGSKAGWLIAIGMAAVALFRSSQFARYRYWMAALVLLVGLTVFFVRFQSYFQKGATSAVARFIYWDAAWKTATANPIVGTGPGTFQEPFKKLKPPEAEMARLVHNDYLEQASDSGFPGFSLYSALITGVLIFLYRCRLSPEQFLIWLGLLGWAVQGLVEFGLYIPAIAWTAFLLLGCLLGRSQTAREPLETAPQSLR